MRARHTHDVVAAAAAVLADALALWTATLAAAWLRFDSGWFPAPFGRDPDLYRRYAIGGLVAVAVNYVVMRRLKLYRRPQSGSFSDKIPRIVRAAGWDVVVLLVLMAMFKNYAQYSNGVALLLFPAGVLTLLPLRGLLFRAEWSFARRSPPSNAVLILGTDATAGRLARSFGRDPRLRIKVAGVLRIGDAPLDESLRPEQLLGADTNLEALIDQLGPVSQIIVSEADRLDRARLEQIVTLCERRMIRFLMVPDLFRLLMTSMEVETVDDIPLLGIGHWPLDNAWNRAAKRLEDVLGSLVGLLLSAPVIALFALLHRRESPGPAFFRQTRCGRGGRPFTIYKLRTMKLDAEAGCGPVFAQPDDPRRTRIGAWMRAHNIDELPQFWNVLKGDMSLVGPRPERPVFVDRFADDLARYMWRHACRPGMTGWAQVNGFRGDTSIPDRLRCDLFYLENWSLALDFKILLRTLFALRNAY